MFKLIITFIGFIFAIGFFIYAVKNLDLVIEAIFGLAAAMVTIFIVLAKKLTDEVNKNL